MTEVTIDKGGSFIAAGMEGKKIEERLQFQYGLNFGLPDIPPKVRARLPKTFNRKGWLVGATNSRKVLASMLIIADNGHRQLGILERKGTYGIYAY